MAEREGGNSWRVPCFCEKKVITTAFCGIHSVTVFDIQDFDTRWGADEDSGFLQKMEATNAAKMSMSANRHGALSKYT